MYQTTIVCVILLFSFSVKGQTVFDITKYNGKGDGSFDNTKAIAEAIEAASKAGGGIVHIPTSSKPYMTGHIELKNNIVLELADNVHLKFFDNFDLYVTGKDDKGHPTRSHLIYGSKVKNVTLRGGKSGKETSIIDGSGEKWWKEFTAHKDSFNRPNLFQVANSEQIRIERLLFINSPMFALNPYITEHIVIDQVKVNNPGSNAPNTDGIHPTACRYVEVSNSFVNTGDDGIVFSAGSGHPSEHMLVHNCEVHSAHGGIVIGSPVAPAVRNLTAHDLTFDGTETGIRIKSYAHKGGLVEDIHISNIKMKNIKHEAITINANYNPSAAPSSGQQPTYKNIVIHNITGNSVAGIQILGLSDNHFQNFELKDINMEAKEATKITNTDHLTQSNVTVKH